MTDRAKHIFFITLIAILGLFVVRKLIVGKEKKWQAEGFQVRNSELYKKAKRFYSETKYDEAFGMYKALIKLHPEQEWLKLELGDKYGDASRFREELSCLRSINDIERLPVGQRQIILRKGIAYRGLEMNDSSRYYYNQLLQMPTRHHKHLGYDLEKNAAYGALARMAYDEYDYSSSIELYTKALELHEIPRYRYIRAHAYYLVGEESKAIDDYNQSIEMIRKMVIHDHPVLSAVMCDTCGTFFGKPEYMEVLKPWRTHAEQMARDKQIMDKVRASSRGSILFDSISSWRKEKEELRGKYDDAAVERYLEITDSLEKYKNYQMRFNIYD